MSKSQDVLQESIEEVISKSKHLFTTELEPLLIELQTLETANVILKDEYARASLETLEILDQKQSLAQSGTFSAIKTRSAPTERLEPALASLEARIHDLEMITKELDEYTTLIENWSAQKR